MVEVTQELLPCPFCGGAAKAVTCRFDMWIVECGEKHSNGLFYREKGKAIVAWNTRHQPQLSAEQATVEIPRAIAEHVVDMGYVDWGETAEMDEAGHIAHVAESLRLTREHFNLDDVPVSMHGLYLQGTDIVLCHTGTSPNSGANAQALAGAWNWLYKQAKAAIQRGDWK